MTDEHVVGHVFQEFKKSKEFEEFKEAGTGRDELPLIRGDFALLQARSICPLNVATRGRGPNLVTHRK
jgi:hypothetical protein